jgi:hypothetical protein
MQIKRDPNDNETVQQLHDMISEAIGDHAKQFGIPLRLAFSESGEATFVVDAGNDGGVRKFTVQLWEVV